MNSFFKSILVSLAAVAAIAFSGVASAQEVQSTCSGCVITTPAPQQPTFAPALSFSAWQYSAGTGVGQNAGGDGKGTVQTFAMNDTQMNLIGRLAANTQGSCEVDCNLTLSQMQIDTKLGTGALATNQGIGNSPVSSTVNSQSFGAGAMQLRNVFVPAPSAP